MKYKTDSELLTELKEPFTSNELDWRVQFADNGKDNKPYASLVAYIDARAIQNRLDNVCGTGGWWNQPPQYSSSGKGVNQGITIKLPEAGEITKWDGADETAIEAVKGGLSSAFKRSAVLWGIGRYLYDIEIAYVNLQKDKPQSTEGWVRTKVKIGGRAEMYYFKKPTLPKEFLPKENINVAA